MDLLWSGPRESDISGLNIFCASTTIFGSNRGNNRSYSKSENLRVDHNQPDCITNDFYNEKFKEWLYKYPDLKILYYNSIYSQYLPREYKNRVVGCNDLFLLKLLDSKKDVRKLASRIIPVVPFQEIYSINQLLKTVLQSNKKKRYIFQENHASGGYGTHIIDKENIDLCIESTDLNKEYFLSPYFNDTVSINVHCILFDDEVIICPGSIQLVKEINNKINYLGSDFIEYKRLPEKVKKSTRENSKRFCEMLRDMGYRGVLGIDFLIIDNQPHLLEVNARFQASTPLLNRALKEAFLPSMQEMHLLAFKSNPFIDRQKIENLNVSYSMAAYTTDTWKKDLSLFESKTFENIVCVEYDGYDDTETILSGAYLFHVIFNTNLCSINAENGLWIYENLYDICNCGTSYILNKSVLHIKISLLNQGVIITEEAKEFIEKQGKIRNAVFNAVDLTIMDGLHVNCPTDVKMVYLTPWKIKVNNNKLKLYYYNNEISDVSVDIADPFANKLTKSGLPYQRIGFWATDRIRIQHTISCVFKKNDVGCSFCEIPKQKQLLRMDDIFEVIDFYLSTNNTFRHFLIGGGSETYDKEAEHITQIASYIHNKSDKPIYLMCLPPKDLSVLQTWHDAGITEIAFNLELYNRFLAKAYMPGKGSIPLSQYISAFDKAVSLWGNTGNVRTLFIAGLESQENLLEGIEAVCCHGVMPILSIFRALYQTKTQDLVPPQNAWLYDLYIKGESICQKYNLHLGPSCPACQNNTLSLPF